MQPKTNVYGVLSLNFAIISIVTLPCAFGSLIFGITALVFGIAGAGRKDAPIGTAVSGIVWSSVTIILSTIILLSWEVIVTAISNFWN